MKKSILSLFIITAALFTTSCKDEGHVKKIPTNGLVGEFLFSGNAKDTNPTDYKNNGTENGGVTLTTDRKGKANAAYFFDGIDDYISIEDNTSLDFESDQDFTISTWVSVNFPQASPDNVIYDIIRKWNGDTQGYPYSISFLNQYDTKPNTFLFVRYDGSGCLNAPLGYSTAISDASWNHIVMRKEGSVISVYLNNVKSSEFTDETTCGTSNNSHITIGCRGQLVRFFKGKIDDVRFYDRALTDKEINQLYKE